MKQTESEYLPTERGMDTALAQMAEDVPPMPADFHEKWMKAVREEAKKTTRETEQPSGKTRGSIARWTRILSTAAVFVFLIGGTLLYRNSRRSMVIPRNSEEKAVMTAAGDPADNEMTEEDAADNTIMDAYAAESTGMDTNDSSVPVAGVSKEVSAAVGAAMDTYAAGVYEEAPVMAEESMAEAASEEYAAWGNAEEQAAENFETGESVKGREDFSDKETPTGDPEPDSFATSSPTEPIPVPQEESDNPMEETGFLQKTGMFMTDMGDFLLAALPYLAVLAVPAVTAFVIRSRKKR